MNLPKVQSMTSPRTGAAVANQFVLTDTNKSGGARRVFQSYDTIIAVKSYDTITDKEYVTLDAEYWNYSRTTSKYRNEFLNETTKETEKKIKSGEYATADLNK